MKYYKTSKFTKAVTSTGFIAIAACTLIAIGAITWFVLSRNTDVNQTTLNNLPSYPDNNNSYNNQTDLQNSTPQTPITDVDDEVSDVPFTPEPEVETPQEPPKPSFVLPVTGNISKGYSDTALQYSATYGDMRLHTGVDILCKSGSNIKSASSGTVKSVVEDAVFGKVITIEHPYDITVKYCGLGSVNVVEGAKVNTGDIIGTSGEIPGECADKPHIHIEVFVKGEGISPLAALGLE